MFEFVIILLTNYSFTHEINFILYCLKNRILKYRLFSQILKSFKFENLELLSLFIN